MVMRTKINRNTPGSPSLRTTIPEAIVEYLELNKGDELDWQFEFFEGAKVIVVRKAVLKSASADLSGKLEVRRPN